MTDQEMNDFLASIGGLESGYYNDKPPILDCGFFCVDNGWFPLIKTLIEDLIELGWNKQTCQVKEKFGGLRFYINDGSDEIHNRITQAEDESYKTCEICGEKGELRNDIGWYSTVCEKHYNDKKETYEKRNSNA